MNSTLWKFGIIAVLFILLHCVNDPPSTVHLLLNLEVEERNDTSRVYITTTVPEDYSYHQIIDDQGRLIVSYRKLVFNSDGDLVDSTLIDTNLIANDPTASQSGTFKGVWEIPRGLSFDSLYPNTPIFFNGYLKDETNHNVCASLILHEDTTLTKIW